MEACFTKLEDSGRRELSDVDYGGSFTELSSYTLLPIVKIFGSNYEHVSFESIYSENGVDIYTKAYFRYKASMATSKTGLGVKSEGQLIISGTKGYIVVDAPWWKTQSFEIKYEDKNLNEKFFTKFLGDGLRYEISDFVSAINGYESKSFKLTKEESVFMAQMIEKFLAERNIITEKEISKRNKL